MTKSLSMLLPNVIKIAKDAGQCILDIYQEDKYQSYVKDDETPVTSADFAAHKLILKRLKELAPEIPILSEEDEAIELAIREKWERYWLVDPLDGTQEFIAKSGDFASVIALIENHQPVMGVVYAPVSDTLYYATKGNGAWKVLNVTKNPDEKKQINTYQFPSNQTSITVAVSRRQKIQNITKRLAPSYQYDLLPLGSAALKACLVAEGTADCYLRLGPTGEWDTGATQCIVQEAGGNILSTQLEPLSYNRRKTLENPNFIVLGDESLDWKTILQITT